MKELEVKKQLPVITTNFNDVKVSLTETIAKYKGIVVTEERLQDCKATQKELAGIRNKIDDFRKTVKKDMEAPIKEFEGQCKELMGLVADAEQPIKDGITVFDNKRRAEKREKALAIIEENIKVYQLEEKYSTKLTVLDKYLNLSASAKSVKEDIERRAIELENEQSEERKAREIQISTINATIESANININSKLKFEDFQRYLDMNYPLDKIVREINIRAETIKKAENPTVQQPKEEIKTTKQEPASIPVKIEETPQKIDKRETMYFYELRIVANKENMTKLSKLLKDEEFEYTIRDKGTITK